MAKDISLLLNGRGGKITDMNVEKHFQGLALDNESSGEVLDQMRREAESIAPRPDLTVPSVDLASEERAHAWLKVAEHGDPSAWEKALKEAHGIWYSEHREDAILKIAESAVKLGGQDAALKAITSLENDGDQTILLYELTQRQGGDASLQEQARKTFKTWTNRAYRGWSSPSLYIEDLRKSLKQENNTVDENYFRMAIEESDNNNGTFYSIALAAAKAGDFRTAEEAIEWITTDSPSASHARHKIHAKVDEIKARAAEGGD